MPLPSQAFFGRDRLIKKIADLAEDFTPIALIGAGGIGKTSIALAVLHHDRIKQRFGHDRRFIRCDQFPRSCPNFLRQLSKVIGAGVENPENLSSLWTVLSSREMVIVLDNAESILDPRGADAPEIYDAVEELCRFENLWICITSRISTTPPGYKHLNVPTLSMDAAIDTFYGIYNSDTQSDVVNGILEQLDFHPLSITLFATVAYENRWSMNRLAREWSQRRTRVLKTQHDESLASAIELSLSSRLFRQFGPNAHALLEVVAFFPQGVDEKNLNWLFPTILNRTDIFDTFCILSLTYRSNGFVTMLAPLRDHLSPKDPKASRLLQATKGHYFTRMSVNINPNDPYFGETGWIVSEDINIEHLLDVFTTVDINSDDVWIACSDFMEHLRWHKPRRTILKAKMEGLPDDHRLKPECLFRLSLVFGSVGNYTEYKRLVSQALNLRRGWGSDHEVAETLLKLSDANWKVDLCREGIEQGKEALGIYERLGDTARQAQCLIKLAMLWDDDKQFDAAEEAIFRAVDLLPKTGEQFIVCDSHRILGNIYQSKGKTDEAIHHYELALRIASSFGWHDHLFWVHYKLADLYRNEGRFDDACDHIERAKPHTVDSAYNLGYAMELQAEIWYEQHRLEEARSEALHAAQIYEKLGAAKDMEDCAKLLRMIEEGLSAPVASGQSSSNCELL